MQQKKVLFFEPPLKNKKNSHICKYMREIFTVFDIFRTISYPSERLPHLLTLQRIGLISAEDEDLAIMQIDLCFDAANE